MLKRSSNPPTLIIAGAWNPDILTPTWIAQEAMGESLKPDFPVKVQLPIGDPTQRPIFEFDKIKYRAAKNHLTFFLTPDDLDRVRKAIGTAVGILRLLSHTPVTGFGFNFSYEIEEPSAALRKRFSSSGISLIVDEPEAQTVVQAWSSSVKMPQYLLTLNAKLEGSKVFLEFNVHFEVDSAKKASELLSKEGQYDLADQVTSGIATRLYESEEGIL